MSAAAEALANACTHPQVKGSRRALMEAIAKLIPEGAVMTAPIALDDLATRTGYNRRTLEIAGEVLETVGLLQIYRARGLPASYELVTSTRHTDPLLPLLGRPRPPRTRVEPERPTLFDAPTTTIETPAIARADVDARAYTLRSFVARWVTIARSQVGVQANNLRSFFVGWNAYPRSFFVGGATNLRSFFVGWHHVLDVDDARARDVRTHVQDVHTHTPPAARTRASPHPWHAWCAGTVHVPMDLHVEYRRKLRLTDDDLFAIYAQECAALAPDAVIPTNDFTFWRPRLAARFVELSAPCTTDGGPRPQRAAAPSRPWTCPHEPPECVDRETCIDRQAADFRARERQRRSAG